MPNRPRVKNPEFDLSAGIAVQKEQLAEWRHKLSYACFLAVKAWCDEKNAALVLHNKTPGAKGYRTGYDVPRGTDLENFILNWSPK